MKSKALVITALALLVGFSFYAVAANKRSQAKSKPTAGKIKL